MASEDYMSGQMSYTHLYTDFNTESGVSSTHNQVLDLSQRI